jgi:hypothetical protein
MAFRERDPIKRNMVFNNKVTDQINTYNYLGCLLTYEKGRDVPKKEETSINF